MVTVTIPPSGVVHKAAGGSDPKAKKQLHIILEVGGGSLVAYRRIVLDVEDARSSVEQQGHDEL